MTQLPMDQLANRINVRIKAAEGHMIAAGKDLIEAKRRVADGEEGEISWTVWCEKNIKAKDRMIRLCMQVAGAPDPEEALKSHQERRQEANQRYYEKNRTEIETNRHLKMPVTPDNVVPIKSPAIRAKEIIERILAESEEVQEMVISHMQMLRKTGT